MFNIQSLLGIATQALAKKFVSSDQTYQQYSSFCKKFGLGNPSRAEFDSFVSQFNNTSQDQKLSQLQGISGDQISKIMSNITKS